MNFRVIFIASLYFLISYNAFGKLKTNNSKADVTNSMEFIQVAPDSWHFETAETHKTFIPIGVNYYDPATYHTDPYGAFRVIGKFDSARTDRHFAQLKDLGANIVRIFLSTVSFEPQLFKLNDTSFQTLDVLISLARKHNMYLILDLVETWEGEPAWQSWEYFAEEQTLQGFEFLLNAFGERYKNEPAVFAWDLLNEPATRGPDSGIMGDLFGIWVRFKYRTTDNLMAAWNDYPLTGELWNQIKTPSYESFNDQESRGSTRFYDFQLFREDIAYNWTRRLTDALRSADTNHMITVGLDQHSVPFKPDGTYYKPYTSFNPHKIAPLLDYISVHGYDWWGEYADEFIEGLLRYSYTGKPVVLEEFDLNDLGLSINKIKRSCSGWLQWAAYESQADWQSCLFDTNEQVTPLGLVFRNIADSIGTDTSARPGDEDVVNINLKDVLISRMMQDTVYRKYVTTVHNQQGPAGFSIMNYQAPNLIKIAAPAPNEKWDNGTDVQIKWYIINWNILYKTKIDIKLSIDNGINWKTIASELFNTGIYNWTISETPSDSCIIEIIDHNDSTVFSIQKFKIGSTPSAIKSDDRKIPITFALEQNYPNPFNPTTIIRFSIPNVASDFSLSHTTLKVYNILGREIAVLVNKKQKPGYYEVKWDAGNHPSGIYFFKLTSGSFVQTKKAVLLK